MLALGIASAALLFATELATLSYRTIGIGGCTSREDPGVCMTTGGDAHGQALWLIALLVLVLSLGAAVGRSRPAALGVIVCGLIALAIGLFLDRPDLDGLRGLDAKYTDVTAHTGAAFTLELIGGALAVLAGLVALRAASGPRAPRDSGDSSAPPRRGPRRRPRKAVAEPEEGATAEERAAARAAARKAREP